MEDKDIDTHLRQYFSGDPPPEAFKQQTLRDSTTEFVRVRRRRSARRKVELAAAAMLVCGISFFAGRLSLPHMRPGSIDESPRVAAEPDSVTVPSELVAWLNAARFFRQLGMVDRMARAIDRAGRLLPYDPVTAGSATGRAFATKGDGIVENQSKQLGPAGILRPHVSVENANGIMAQFFGGNNHASEKD